MATTYKVLGQVAPAATTLTSLYTVGAGAAAITSTLTICNIGASATTFRIAIRPIGAALASQHYIMYDAAIATNDTMFLTLGLTLAAGDVVSVYAGTEFVVFNLFGSEVV